MNFLRLSDSEIEPAIIVLETALEDFDFSGDIEEHKMEIVLKIMLKQLNKISDEKELEK